MKCIVCNSNSTSSYVRDFYKLNKKTYSLVKCSKCGFVFVNPFPPEKDINGMYEGRYFDECYDSGMSEGSYFENKEKMRIRYVELLKSVLKFKKSGSIVEVGCAGGFFLELAASHGFKVQGVELSKGASKDARKLGLKVFNGTLKQAGFKPNSFDIVYMGHVLEHVANPRSMVREARRILKDKGILIIEVPSFVNSPYYNALRAFYSIVPIKPLPMFKIVPKGRYLKPYHLLEFSPKTMRMLLRQEKFHVLRLEQSVPIPDIILKKSKSIKALPLKLMFKTLETMAKLGFRGGSITVFALKH